MTTDVSTTKRKPLTPTERRKLWEEHKGICCICKLPIDPAKGFIDEHVIPLALGGSNDWSNRGPAHKHCAAVKTLEDAERWTKAKRQKNAHLGIKREPKSKIPSRAKAEKPARDKLDMPPRRALYEVVR